MNIMIFEMFGEMSIVIITALFALGIAFIIGLVLGFFREFFFVPDDPTVAEIRALLPGGNCGACGFPGCDSFAAAVAKGDAPTNACTVGGGALPAKIAAITGGEAGESVDSVAVLACQGSSLHAPGRGIYTGVKTCRAAKVTGATKQCPWGCLGFADCQRACKFDAISMNENNLPKIDYSKCTGCRLCAKECPLGLFHIVPRNRKGSIALCSNVNPVKQIVVKSCRISCFKCNLCVKFCPQKCISLETNIPVVDYTKCDSCGVCVEKCPAKVMKILEKDVII